jgi:DNA adenine methylase
MAKTVSSRRGADIKPEHAEKQPSSTQLKPFLRWAGGKRRLTGLLMESFPEHFSNEKSRFYEPFVGGGALAFATGDSSSFPYIPGKNLYINDSNPDLVIVYRIIRDQLQELVSELNTLSLDVSKKAYETVRASNPRSEVKRAARFIYLNKTCFNGLWRVNASGQFNVPWGQLKNPLIYDPEQLAKCSERLKNATISNEDFHKAVRSAREGDLVYFDPPYIPLSVTASFSQYAKGNFGLSDHEILADTIKALTSKGVFVILSNSDTEDTRRIFKSSLTLRQISMNRSISAASGSRKPVNEVIGTNFPAPRGSLLSALPVISRQKAGI